MIKYSVDDLKDIFNSDEFINIYKTYNDKYKLSEFLDSININKDYYKVKMNTEYDHSTENKQLLTALEFLNKITSENYKKITSSIIETLIPEIIDIYSKHLLEKIIQQEIYSNEYNYILNTIHENFKDNFTETINKHIKYIFDSINKKKEENTKYDKLCNHNKLVDNLVGYYRMIILINKSGYLEDDIKKITLDIVNKIKNSDDENQYKYLQCLYSIIDTDKKLYTIVDKDLTNHLKSKKNKFLLMDIKDLI
jgi:hypothetical protein